MIVIGLNLLLNPILKKIAVGRWLGCLEVDNMNKYESMLAGGIVSLFVVVLLVRAILHVVEVAVAAICSVVTELTYAVVDGVEAFFGLTPPWFWGLAVMIGVVVGLVYLALMAFHSIAKMRNQSAIVEIRSPRAFVFQNGTATAVSFEGKNIITKQIDQPQRLTPTEEKILLRMIERRQIAHDQPKLLKGGVA
jgi:hypothetical protein